VRAIVVAYGANRGIGYQGGLPWRLPSDLRRFRELTLGGTVLMGRKTYESLPDAFRPLPGRRNVVVSANPGFDPAAVGASPAGGMDGATTGTLGTAAIGTAATGTPGTSVEARRGIEAALQACGSDCFVIGGGSVYEQTLPLVQRVYATVVHHRPLSDTYFPALPGDQWCVIEQGEDIRENGISFHFATYDRRR
jgi:dihydrofolate reductase